MPLCLESSLLYINYLIHRKHLELIPLLCIKTDKIMLRLYICNKILAKHRYIVLVGKRYRYQYIILKPTKYTEVFSNRKTCFTSSGLSGIESLHILILIGNKTELESDFVEPKRNIVNNCEKSEVLLFLKISSNQFE